jgi:hypothetical protein
VAEAILAKPVPGQEQPRYQLVDGASVRKQELATEHGDEILALADELGMRRETSLNPEELSIVSPDPEDTVWVVEGGANKTSVVRAELAAQAAREVYGGRVSGVTLQQFGSARFLTEAEKRVAREIAPDHYDLVHDEFSLNVASALQAGCQIVAEGYTGDGQRRFVDMYKPDGPNRQLVEVAKSGGTQDGLEYLRRSIHGKRIVLSTSGQYRTKDKLMIATWAAQEGIDMLAPIVLGDEAGFQADHNGKTYTTAMRPPLVYLNEEAIVARMAAEAKHPRS